MKAMIFSPVGGTDFFDIVSRVLENVLIPHLFVIWLDYMLWMSVDLIKENGFTLKNPRSRQYPTETVTDADYTDDQMLFANTLAQA